MPFQSSNLSQTIVSLGLWHVSIISPTTELTLASVIDTTVAADSQSCSVKGPSQDSSSGAIKGWSPPDADESFEAGQLSEDFSDSSDEEEEVVYTLNSCPFYNRSRVLYTIQEEDDSWKGLYTIFEENEDESGSFDQGAYSVAVGDDGDSEDGEYEEYQFDLSVEDVVDGCEVEGDGDEDTCEEDELSKGEIESIVALALKLVVPSKSVDELVAADNWDGTFDESSLSMSSRLTVEPGWEVSDEDLGLAEVFGKGVDAGSFRMPEPCNLFGGFEYDDDFDFEDVFNEKDSLCEPLRLKKLVAQVSCSSEEEEEEDWDSAFDESPVPGTPVAIHSACPEVVSIPFKSATERMAAWRALLSSLDSVEDVDNLLRPAV